MKVYFSRYPRPISVARKVLNNPSLSMLVGTGATDFAAENGFILESNMALISDKFNKVRYCIVSVKPNR